MDARVAEGAVLVARVSQRVSSGGEGDAVALAAKVASAVVAFEAKGEDLGAAQEAGVETAMGEMAGGAAIDADGGVFKGEGAALVDVALEAGLFVLEARGDHAGTGGHAPGGGVGAVGIMAVGALHEAFVDAVFDGLGELGLDVGVALVAELGLGFGEELAGRGGLVDGMTGGAGDVGGGVGGAADVGAGELFGVAGEAVVEGGAGGELGEGDDFGFVAFAFDMGAAGAVAGLAVVFRFEVGVTEEGLGQVGVTAPAGVTAGEAGRKRLSKQQQQETTEQEKTSLGGLYGRRLFFARHFFFAPGDPLLEEAVEPGDFLGEDHEAGDEKDPAGHDGEDEADDAEENERETGEVSEQSLHYSLLSAGRERNVEPGV